MKKHATEIVIFKVSNPETAMKVVYDLVEDAKAFNNSILSAELYQSVSDPNMFTQRIVWKSLEEAKAAFAASENFPNMAKLMELQTEEVFFDHFYLQEEGKK